MPKPRCRFYPEEIARRQCPALPGPLSARACREKFLVDIQCKPECPFIEDNFTYELNRTLNRLRRRVNGEFNVPPEWMYQETAILPFLHLEALLACYGQWYPGLADREVLDVLEDVELSRRAASSGLSYDPRFQAGRAGDLRRAVEARLGYVVGGLAKASKTVGEAEMLASALEKVRASIHHHSGKGERGYLDFIIPFAEPVEPKPVAGRIFLR